jgi:hypothetical protein
VLSRATQGAALLCNITGSIALGLEYFWVSVFVAGCVSRQLLLLYSRCCVFAVLTGEAVLLG